MVVVDSPTETRTGALVQYYVTAVEDTDSQLSVAMMSVPREAVGAARERDARRAVEELFADDEEHVRVLEEDASVEVNQGVIASIRNDLDAALPGLGAVATTHAWCCFRPAHPDGLPVIDRVPGLDNAWLTSGHFRTGILMAPATAAALAAWIASGRPPTEIAALAATRLLQ